MPYSRVEVTGDAAEMLRHLSTTYGALMFHQSGGCCDGSSPMCFPVGMFITSAADVLLQTMEIDGLAPIEFFMSASQYEYWKYTHLTVDIVPGRGSGFSVEAPEGKRFLIRSRMMTDDEIEHYGLLTKEPARS